jgi:hypothetical membrane protein
MQTLFSHPLADYRIFGILGSLVITLGILLSGLLYRGKQGQRYSIFNHFISELGELGISRGAVVFNAGLIAGGIILLPFCIALGLLIPHWLAYAGMAAGLWAALSAIGVGIFPMNQLKPHTWVALSYFRSGLLMAVCFTLAILFQPAGEQVLPLVSIAFGILTVAAYAAFLSIPWKKEGDDKQVEDRLNPEQEKERPRFWLMPFLEWLVFFTTIAWFLLIALSIQA